MKSDAIYDAMQVIATYGSTKAKADLLKKFIQDDVFSDCVLYALNPFKTYGIRPDKEAKRKSGVNVFDETTWEMLELLSTRHLSGSAAVNAVESHLAQLEPKSQTLLINILHKDLRMGVGISMVNDVAPKFVPRFEVMLAQPFNKFADRCKYPVVVEPKLDGVRVLIFVRRLANNDPIEAVNFYSRSGKSYTTLDHLKKPIYDMFLKWSKSEYTGVVLDGEVISGDFTKTVSQVREKLRPCLDAKIFLFDFVHLSDFENFKFEQSGNYMVRRQILKDLVDHAEDSRLHCVPSVRADSYEEVLEIYQKCRLKKLEGAMVKDPKHFYEPNRSASWLKLKAQETSDLQIVDVIEGTGKYKGCMGAIVVDNNGVRVNVGTGFTDSQRSEIWELRQDVIGRLVEVEFHEKTKDGSLRHPRFIRFRDDKCLEEVVL